MRTAFRAASPALFAPALLATVSAVALLSAAPAFAQEAPATQAADEAAAVDEIVVTGTRVANRSRLDTLAPVDVVTAQSLQNRGTTEFAAALAQSIPSLSFQRPSANDGSRFDPPDHSARPVAGPDAGSGQRHASPCVGPGQRQRRGGTRVGRRRLEHHSDRALDRVEVLRDGASAQYGSDAIAGVVNLRLKEASSGGGASVTYGQYFTTVKTARGERDETDGGTVTASAWQGFHWATTAF
jgi:iron complex outermembrane recepter protein